MSERFLSALPERWSGFSEQIFPWRARERQAQLLALEAETQVRQLNGLEAQLPDAAPNDLLSVLRSTCILLDRLVDRPDLLDQSSRLHQSTSAPDASSQTTLFNLATELIKLRDWVLLAKQAEPAGSRSILEPLYERLGKVLEQAGFSSFEETGRYNHERHSILSTQPTDNPALNDCVAQVIRPGYQVGTQLIRPQEVILSVFQP